MVREEMERGVFDIETVKNANATLIATINESLAIADEGKARRAAAEAELVKMEAELRDTLASATARTPASPRRRPERGAAAGMHAALHVLSRWWPSAAWPCAGRLRCARRRPAPRPPPAAAAGGARPAVAPKSAARQRLLRAGAGRSCCRRA